MQQLCLLWHKEQELLYLLQNTLIYTLMYFNLANITLILL